jgi:hypothetical protein
VWIQGPYPAGKYTNIKIFNKVLRHFLDPGELVEADDGYVGHTDKINFPQNEANPVENRAMQFRVRARHEMLNGRLKNWGILSQNFAATPLRTAMCSGRAWRWRSSPSRRVRSRYSLWNTRTSPRSNAWLFSLYV